MTSSSNKKELRKEFFFAIKLYFFSTSIGRIIGRLSVREYRKSCRFSMIALRISLSLGLSLLAISVFKTW